MLLTVIIDAKIMFFCMILDNNILWLNSKISGANAKNHVILRKFVNKK